MLRLCGSKYQQLLATPDGVKSFHTAVIDLIKLIEGVVNKGREENELYNKLDVNLVSINIIVDNQQDAVHMMIEIVGSLQSQGEYTSR